MIFKKDLEYNYYWQNHDNPSNGQCRQLKIYQKYKSTKGTVDNDDTRICTNCGEVMNSGYVINDGEEYFCSDDCLYGYYSDQEYQELCENDLAYWTEW